MGLIPADHPHSLNKDLEQAILETFSLQIINEYDLKLGKKYSPETVKPHPFMARVTCKLNIATNKARLQEMAEASGMVTCKASKLTFDISSRGTGATILSPGAQEADGAVADRR